MNFENKVVLITGASSGIGAETAILLANLGASLSLTGRNLKGLQETAEKCKTKNGTNAETFLIVGDLSKENDVVNILDETIRNYGRLDVLINNAGIISRGTLEDCTLEQFDSMINVNMRSVFQLTKLAMPHLIKSKGNVVNVSSVMGTRSFPGMLSYSISKAALDQFTRCVALEVANKQVRVNSVNPGLIVTNLQRSAGMDEQVYKNMLEQSKTNHPLGRPGQADEVAGAIAFLASAMASNITAVTLSVDGGRHAACPR